MNDLDDLIDRWHERADDNQTLADFLGVKRETYAAWAEGRMTDAELLATREEPHHRAARQPTDEERAAVRKAALESMRAGLPGLRAKAAEISARSRGRDET